MTEKTMTDYDKKIQAMFYLETCSEPQDEHGTPKDDEFVYALITAAHYLIQSMFNGPEPDNYQHVMELADAYIALDEARETVYLAQIKLGIDEV